VTTKRCPQCKRSKLVEDFPRNRSTRDGRAAYCKPCHNRSMSEQKQRLYGGERSYLLNLRYGVNEAQLEWLKLQQDGRCAICREAPRSTSTTITEPIRCAGCSASTATGGSAISTMIS
jgi:hypothetical protein